MGMKVETLIVFATNRPGIIDDHVAAIHWSHLRSHTIVVVDDTLPADALSQQANNRYTIPSQVRKDRRMSGFKNNEAIRFALDVLKLDFRYVCCLDDDALPIGRGLDDWAIRQMDATAIDLLGVRDRVNYQTYWNEVPRLLGSWLPEALEVKGAIDLQAETIFYAANWMSRGLVDAMHGRDLLVPPGCERWPLWPDVYVSWVAQLLGAYQVTWGHMDAPRPPLYCNHRNHMRFAPDPGILRRDFLLYHPIRFVTSYDEATLRGRYAAMRRSRS
jgi:hypothetical protein